MGLKIYKVLFHWFSHLILTNVWAVYRGFYCYIIKLRRFWDVRLSCIAQQEGAGGAWGQKKTAISAGTWIHYSKVRIQCLSCYSHFSHSLSLSSCLRVWKRNELIYLRKLALAASLAAEGAVLSLKPHWRQTPLPGPLELKVRVRVCVRVFSPSFSCWAWEDGVQGIVGAPSTCPVSGC